MPFRSTRLHHLRETIQCERERLGRAGLGQGGSGRGELGRKGRRSGEAGAAGRTQTPPGALPIPSSPLAPPPHPDFNDTMCGERRRFTTAAKGSLLYGPPQDVDARAPQADPASTLEPPRRAGARANLPPPPHSPPLPHLTPRSPSRHWGRRGAKSCAQENQPRRPLSPSQ